MTESRSISVAVSVIILVALKRAPGRPSFHWVAVCGDMVREAKGNWESETDDGP